MGRWRFAVEGSSPETAERTNAVLGGAVGGSQLRAERTNGESRQDERRIGPLEVRSSLAESRENER